MPRMRSNGSNRCIRIFLFGIICISLVLNYRSHSEILATHLIHEEGFAIEFDAANNDNNVPDINSVALAGDQDHTGGTEQIVFAQLYERAKQSKEQCSRQYRTGANANTNHTKPALSLNTASFSNPQMMRNSSVGTQEEICHLPPKESCVSDYEYTAVVTFHASGNHTNISHRTLFMNLLALIAKDNFAFAATSSGTQSKSNNGPDADVIVLYHGSVENLNRDKMYGRRILNWHRDNTIRLVHESELVHDSNGSINNTRTEGILFYLFHESLVKYMQHDIILYLDGSVPFAGMGNGVGIGEVSVVDTLQVGFQLMRNNAQILVGNQLYHYSGISPLTTGIRNNAVATATNHDDFVPVCQDEATNTSSAHTQENEVSILNFSGIFLHRNYLCFIWRDEFSALRELIGSMTNQYTTTSTSTSNANHSIIMELTSLFVTQVVTQVSGRSPLLYPLVKPSWSRNHNSQVDASTRRLSEIAVMDGGNVESHSDTPRRRRSNWVAPNDTVATFHHYTTEDRRKLSEIEGNHIMQPKSQSQSTQSVSSEDVLSILNYFGSYSKDPSCWCSSVDDQPPIVGSQTSCLSQCHPGHEGSDIISTKDLSWMTANKTRCR